MINTKSNEIDPERIKYLRDGATIRIHSSLMGEGNDGMSVVKTLSDGNEYVSGTSLKYGQTVGEFLNLAYLALTRAERDLSPCFCSSGKRLNDCCTHVELKKMKRNKSKTGE